MLYKCDYYYYYYYHHYLEEFGVFGSDAEDDTYDT